MPTPQGGFVNYTAFIRPVCLPCTDDNCLSQYLLQQNLTTGNENATERCRIESEYTNVIAASENYIVKCRILLLRILQLHLRVDVSGGARINRNCVNMLTCKEVQRYEVKSMVKNGIEQFYEVRMEKQIGCKNIRTLKIKLKF